MKCKFCKHFSWKLSSGKNWGECLNPKVIDSIRLSLRHVEEIFNHPEPKKLMADIQEFARVQFVEDDFGCIHFEKKAPQTDPSTSSACPEHRRRGHSAASVKARWG